MTKNKSQLDEIRLLEHVRIMEFVRLEREKEAERSKTACSEFCYGNLSSRWGWSPCSKQPWVPLANQTAGHASRQLLPCSQQSDP